MVPRLCGDRSKVVWRLYRDCAETLKLSQLMQAKWSEGTSLFEGLKGGVIVTERRYYEQMRHTYPYSGWVPYDEQKPYSYNHMLANRDKGFGGVVPQKYGGGLELPSSARV